MSWLPWKAKTTPSEAPLLCSFCRLSQHQVAKLVAGPDGAYICDACVGLCVGILAERLPVLPEPETAADLAERLSATVVGQAGAVAALQGLLQAHLASADQGPPAALLVGPAGVGKSTLMEALAAQAGLPSVRADAGRLTASGYVGDDLENFLAELAEQPGIAARGLLLIDGLQHLSARERAEDTSLEVRGTRAQRQVLRLLEGRQAHVGPGRRHPMQPSPLVETRGLMVVLACTLDPLPEGRRAILAALEELGLEPQLLRRIPVVVPMPRRDAPALLEVGEKVREELAVQGRVLCGEAELRALAEEAARAPEGAWRIRQRLSAALTAGMRGDPQPG